MAFTVQVKVNKKDQDRLNANFAHFRRETTPTKVLAFAEQKGYPILQHRARLRFGREGDDAVGMWAPLRPATRRLRMWQAEREGLPIEAGHPIHVRRGAFHRWVTGTHDATSRGSENFSRAIITVPSNRATKLNWKKLKNAQLGGTTHMPQGTQTSFPARPVVAVSHTDQRLVERQAEQWVTSILRGMK